MWLLIVFSLVSTGCVYGQRPAVDKCDSINLDTCGYLIYAMIHRPTQFPRDREDLEKTCMSMRAGMECVKERLEICPTIMSSQLAPGYLESLPRIFAQICDYGGIGDKLIPHGVCYRERMQSFSCPQTWFDEAEGALYERTAEDQLLAVCCYAQKYDQCTYLHVLTNCGKRAADDKQELTDTLSGFLVRECEPVLARDGHKCAYLPPNRLPKNHRRVTNVLATLNDIFYNLLGP